jgi:RNA recognition motif-containing protein
MQGCGIVEYSTKDEAQNAINTMSNRNLMGRLIYVREVSQNRSLATLKQS